MQRFLLSRALPGACTSPWQTVAHRNRRVMVGGGLEVAVGAAFRATGGERDQGDEWAASEASTSSSASSSAPSSAPSSASASSKAATMAPRGKGTLYVVGTPIGNLSDMSVRAIDTLRNADKILCEDTRRTKQLLNHFEIHGARLESYHMHNEYQRTSSVISELLRGQQVALVSDAGMPGINDPGALVIKEAVRHEDDIDVVPIPGPSAFLAALVGSGLLEDSFQYCGFVAAKRSQRLKQFEGLKQHAHALVFYVSPHALVESLKDAVEVFGAARRCCLARELTKLHEEFIRGTLEEVSAMHEGDAGRKPRGEYSIVIEGMQQGGEDAVTEELILKCLEAEMAQGASPSAAAKSVAGSLGVNRKAVYELSIKLKG